MRKRIVSVGLSMALTTAMFAMDTSGFTSGGYATPGSIDAYVNPILEKAQNDLREIGEKYDQEVERNNADGDNDDDAGHLHPEDNHWKPSKFDKAVREKFISDETKAGSFKQVDPQTSFDPQSASGYAKKVSGITNVRNYDREIGYIIGLIEDLGSKCDVKSAYLEILNKLWGVAKEVHKAHFAATYAVAQETGYRNFLSKARALVIAKGNGLFSAANSAVLAQEKTHESMMKAQVNSAVNACLSSCSIPCNCPSPPSSSSSASRGGGADGGYYPPL